MDEKRSLIRHLMQGAVGIAAMKGCYGGLSGRAAVTSGEWSVKNAPIAALTFCLKTRETLEANLGNLTREYICLKALARRKAANAGNKASGECLDGVVVH